MVRSWTHVVHMDRTIEWNRGVSNQRLGQPADQKVATQRY